MTDPYDRWNPAPPPPPRLPDPTQAACVLSSRCVGYQLTEEGIISRTVWSGLILRDGDLTHPVLQYWTDGGGAHVYQDDCPRIDLAMAGRLR